MKTKLLKIVRKRFEIIRVDDIGSDPSDWLEFCISVHGLPLDFLCDKKGIYDYIPILIPHHEFLLNVIRAEYSKKVKPKKMKSTKIWYVNK